MPELWHDTGLPLALDESLHEPGGEAALRGWAAAAVDEGGLLDAAHRRAALLGGPGRAAFSMTKQAWARPVVEAIDTLDPAANRAYPEVPSG